MTSTRPAEEKMTADEFLAWYEQQEPGRRYELFDGVIYPREMASERAAHARVKGAVYDTFKRAIAAAGLPCEAFPDGMAVRIDGGNFYEPDALVRCGPRLPGDAIMIENPVIVVEVASPSTYRVDALTKFLRYFANPHIVHYLIVLPTERAILHHRRGDPVLTASHTDGMLALEPPGLELNVKDLFANM